MIEMAETIGASSLEPKAKHEKLSKFFVLNEKTLNVLGPKAFLEVKNTIGDILRRIGGE